MTNNNPQNWNGNFTFTGTNSLTMGAGLVTLGGNVQLTVTNANTLTIGGTVALAGSANTAETLTVAVAGNVTFNNIISNGGTTGASLGLTMNGSGTLTLSANNTYTGATNVNSGILTLAQTNATIASNSAGLMINNGGTVRVTAINAIANSATAVPVTINNGGILETGTRCRSTVGSARSRSAAARSPVRRGATLNGAIGKWAAQ